MPIHITPASNLEIILKEGLKPQIGPRAAELGEATSAVFLFPDEEAADNALSNWLGDQFDEDDRLAILEVEMSEAIVQGEVEFELLSFSVIPPAQLRLLGFDDEWEWMPGDQATTPGL